MGVNTAERYLRCHGFIWGIGQTSYRWRFPRRAAPPHSNSRRRPDSSVLVQTTMGMVPAAPRPDGTEEILQSGEFIISIVELLCVEAVLLMDEEISSINSLQKRKKNINKDTYLLNVFNGINKDFILNQENAIIYFDSECAENQICCIVMFLCHRSVYIELVLKYYILYL